MSGNYGSDDAVHMMGDNLIDAAKFTFQAPFGSTASSNIFSTTAGEARDPKHPKDHPDGPTPPSSPHKKHIWAASIGTSDQPSPSLLFSSVSLSLPTKDGAIFGSVGPNTNLSGDAAPLAVSLFDFWSKESATDQVE